MSAENYRRKVQHFLNLAQQLSRPEERTVMLALAASWMEQAEQAEHDKCIVEQEQRVQPRKEAKGYSKYCQAVSLMGVWN